MCEVIDKSGVDFPKKGVTLPCHLQLWVKSVWMLELSEECYEVYWTNRWSNAPIKKQLYGHLTPISKTSPIKNKQYTRNIAGEARTNSEVTFLYGPWYGIEKPMKGDLSLNKERKDRDSDVEIFIPEIP